MTIATDTVPVMGLVEHLEHFELPKPLFRGRLHQICFFLSIPAGLALVVAARTGEARVAALVYSLGVTGLYGASGAYHRGNWSPRARRWMQRLDHSMIFVLIAATYTPFCLLVLEGTVSIVLLTAAWVGAIAGLVLALTGVAQKKGIGFTLYLVLGWLTLLAMPWLITHLSPLQLGLMALGGVLYTLGAICLGTRWPDPVPTHFGYHEVWHAMTVVAGLCMAVDVWMLALQG
jgi:hemolysin III